MAYDPKSPEGKTKLDLGAGGVTWRGPDWWMCDAQARPDDPFIARYDFVESGLGLFADETVECVFMMHVLEHIGVTAEDMMDQVEPAVRVLEDIRRLLKPQGILRIGVPDLRLYTEAYVRRDEEWYKRYRVNLHGKCYDGYAAEFVKEICQVDRGDGPHVHRWFYDEGMLWRVVRAAGFTDFWRSEFQQSVIEELRRPGFDNRADITLYMEARK